VSIGYDQGKEVGIRFYAVADIHGKASRIERIQNNISHYKPDVVVVAGDITNLRHARTIIGKLKGKI
jgi:Icc-related predicted phosphoesterase